jgi:hypothetical protein
VDIGAVVSSYHGEAFVGGRSVGVETRYDLLERCENLPHSVRLIVKAVPPPTERPPTARFRTHPSIDRRGYTLTQLSRSFLCFFVSLCSYAIASNDNTRRVLPITGV